MLDLRRWWRRYLDQLWWEESIAVVSVVGLYAQRRRPLSSLLHGRRIELNKLSLSTTNAAVKFA